MEVSSLTLMEEGGLTREMPPEDPGLRTRIRGPGQVLSKPRLRVLLGLPEKPASPTGRALADLTLLLKVGVRRPEGPGVLWTRDFSPVCLSPVTSISRPSDFPKPGPAAVLLHPQRQAVT